MPTRYSLILLLIATLAAACGDEGSSGSPASGPLQMMPLAPACRLGSGASEGGGGAQKADAGECPQR